ncbi:MAG: exodeoxyribonuclease VII large subunit [Deltaproteobacteria bacterium]|nr:exodeoxyribonuclease VII large subunit [Deltaproteobacteria bacterium]
MLVANNIKTVTEVTREITQLLENKFNFVRIIGEISNLRIPASGHHYFNLKDQDAQLRSVLFKNQQRFLTQQLKDGLEVVCDGRITVYKPRGDYQLIIDTIDFRGSGQLQIAFEKLKQKLRSEGLFDHDKKKKIPQFIEKILLITSSTGAAVHDFLSICRKRKAPLLVQILPVRVQGDTAANEISGAIELAQKISPEVIVLCRGGGSIEDLWSFNEETVARAIGNSMIPVVTGIGHETDFTIADFCADMRAATPTAAAEMLIPNAETLLSTIEQSMGRMLNLLTWRLDAATLRIQNTRRFLSRFDSTFNHQSIRLDAAATKLYKNMELFFQRKEQLLDDLQASITDRSPLLIFQVYENRLAALLSNISRSTKRHFEIKEAAFNKTAAILDSVSPLATLARGYAIASIDSQDKKIQKVITDSAQVSKGEKIGVQLHKGTLTCSIISKGS